jgi:dTDP-4-amino-4,6-dideoxygalactose transaminase
MSLDQISLVSMAKPVIGKEEISEVEEVLRSGYLSEGETVRKFESEFAAFIGTEHAVAVNSGTAALHIALLAHGIGPGDEVITTPFTFIATANAVLLTGARPVFADIQPDTFNIDPDEVLKKITSKTRAILPVHLYGQPCDMSALMKIAHGYSLVIIEDACQSHGAEYVNGKKTGSFDTGCFSFYPTKNMTTGEGGIITTNDADIAEKARLIRNHGQNRRYYHEVEGYNYRMTNIAGALGLCQLKKLPYFNEARIKNAQILTAGLRNIEGLVTPRSNSYTKHVFHQYTIRITEEFPVSRDDLRRNLLQRGISTEIYYPRPIHRQPLYQRKGYADWLPVSEQAANEVISLPIHPSLNQQNIRHITESIRSISS